MNHQKLWEELCDKVLDEIQSLDGRLALSTAEYYRLLTLKDILRHMIKAEESQENNSHRA